MKLFQNSLYTFGASALPTLVSVATLPLFVRLVGADRYGALAIAWLALGYFGAADFGIGRAITQRIASMRANGGQAGAAAARAVWSALIAISGFGLAGAGLLYAFAHWYFAGYFRVEEGLRAEIMGAVWLLAVSNPVVALNGVLAGSLMGLERFRLVSASSLIANCGLLLFPLAVALVISTDLSALILAALAARVLGAVILAAGVWRAVLRGHQIGLDRREFARLASFGAWIMVTALIGPVMIMADRFLIGALIDALAVAAYAIPFQIASRTLLLPTALTQALFPRFAAEEGGAASRARCGELTGFVALCFAVPIVVLICLAGPLMRLWLGPALDPRSIIIAQILLAGFWANGIAQVPFAYIQARGDPRFTALLHLAELPAYVLLLLGLGWAFGLAGFACAFSLRCGFDGAALIWRARARARAEGTGQINSPATPGARPSLMPAILFPGALVLAALALALASVHLGALAPATLVLVGLGLGALAMLVVVLVTPPGIRHAMARLPGLPGLPGPVRRWALRG